MIKFLIKGLLRDRSRSLFPMLVISSGVMMTVFLYSWINGVQSDIVQMTAHFDTGHVRVMTKAYSEQADQMPNDLALFEAEQHLQKLRADFPEMIWTPRIKFGGLLDIPDEAGETRAQTPIMGMAVDLLSEPNPELKILNIENSIVKGRVPANPGEILIGEKLAKNLNILPGDLATLISSTMYKSMTMKNFKIVGTVLFGMTALDRGSVIADIADIQNLLDMQNAVGEILGFSADDIYHHDKSERIAHVFNAQYADINDQFTPVMGTLRAQSGIADLLDMVNRFSGAIVMIFLVVMSIVLWNAGLMGSIRRYGEIGIRLAIGEEKGHIYRSMIIESIAIGLLGSVIGTAMGLALSYYMQINGISIDTFMKDTTLLISNVMRARVTPTSFVIGFLPGVLATMLGTCIAGIGIYKRQTSQLFKELEV